MEEIHRNKINPLYLFLKNIMAKIYQEQIQKTDLLLNGLKINASLVKDKGIDEFFLSKLESENKLATTYNEEYDKLKADFKNKGYQINNKIDEIKKQCREAKRIIKKNFDKAEWTKFGILDKR